MIWLNKKKWTSNNKIIYPKSESQPKLKNKAPSIAPICLRNSSFSNTIMFNSSLMSPLYNPSNINPKGASSKITISEKCSTAPALIKDSYHHKSSTKAHDKTHKEIDKSSKHKTQSTLNPFANHSKKESIKASLSKIPSEIPLHHFLKEVKDHMPASCHLYINKTIKWKVKLKKSLAVIVKDPNAWNSTVNASRKKYSVRKIVIVMTVEIINKISLSINKRLSKL